MRLQTNLETHEDADDFVASKRKFLKTLACGALMTAGYSSTAHAMRSFRSHKVLSFQHTHTGDSLKLTYFEHGRYIKDALAEINFLLRDFRNGSIHPIDTALLDQLYDLKLLLGIRKPFHIVSGYRSPQTNARLRSASRGVAKHSLHMEGRAIDIWVEGYDTRLIRNAAVSMRRGGVGYYPHSNFVHMDTGRVRTW